MKKNNYRDGILNLFANAENLTAVQKQILEKLIDLKDDTSVAEIMEIISSDEN
tara:strand:- start:481 stop:639 length:159 start_codon:yes stop_codon:yes gene_type:complete